jgi:small subunit ribosomal protein S6
METGSVKYYEAIFIVHPALEETALAQLVREAKDIFKKRGSDIIYDEEMGKKRLAYPIDKQRFGTFYLFHFKSKGQQNVQLNRDLEHKDNILAHMIVRIEEDEVRQVKPESERETDEVVAGKEEKTTEKVIVESAVENAEEGSIAEADPAPEVTEPLQAESIPEEEEASADKDQAAKEPAK